MRARKRIKIKATNNAYHFVPEKDEILETLSLLKEQDFPQEALIFYKFILESGCRYTELEHLILNFDERNIEEFGNIITYKNFYLRGYKSSYYLFCSKKTFDKLRKVINIGSSFLDYFKRKIQRIKHLVNLNKFKNISRIILKNLDKFTAKLFAILPIKIFKNNYLF